MKVLLEAIITKWKANAALVAACTGGVHRGNAPQRASYPFSLLHLLDQRPEDTFNEFCETAEIQFSIFSDTSSANTVDNVFTNLIALFDYCSLSITGYTHVVMRRTFHTTFKNEEEAVWQCVVKYEVMFQKT